MYLKWGSRGRVSAGTEDERDFHLEGGVPDLEADLHRFDKGWCILCS